MLTSRPSHDSSSSSLRSAEDEPQCSPHPLTRLILHLLPGSPPGMTQDEVMKCIEGVLPYQPDLHMQAVSQPVLSAVLVSLERKRCIDSTGNGAERCYWRIAPASRSSKQEAGTPESNGEALR